MEYTFIYKNNNKGRDCVKYAELDGINKLQCGNYYPQINFSGACYSGDFDKILENEKNIDEIYPNITTILTKEDFKKLAKYNENIKSLGGGLDTQPQKQQQANEFYKGIENIIEKLKSKENENLFEKIIEEEKIFLIQEYNFSENDIERIFNYYLLDFKDRGVVGCVYSDYYDLGEYVYSNLAGDVPSFIEKHFDYESFGESLTNDGDYIELEDGRIVDLNY